MKLYSVRKIDKLGRVCIPKEYTRILDMKENDYIDIQLSENEIVLKKHKQSINYEMLISNLLVHEKGTEYKDYLITNEDILNFKLLINHFILEMIKKK